MDSLAASVLWRRTLMVWTALFTTEFPALCINLGEYADAVLRAEPVELLGAGVALHYAQLASSSVNDRNPTYSGLVAQAEYQLGRSAEAMLTAQKALGLLLAGSAGREQLQRHIAEYRAGGWK